MEQGAADDIRQDPQLWAACKVLICLWNLLLVQANAVAHCNQTVTSTPVQAV